MSTAVRPASLRGVWTRTRRNPPALIALCLVGFFVALALLADLIAPMDPLQQNLALRLSPPMQNGFLLGSDDLGRDILSRIIHGARVSLQVGSIAAVISMVIGTGLGLLSGYFGGWVDGAIMRLIDIMLAFPTILLAIVIVAALGPSLNNAMIAIGLIGVPGFARMIRASVLVERQADYVAAERALGAGHLRLMLTSILPNCTGPIIVQTSLSYAFAITAAAGLSYLGLGAQAPLPEWGLMVATGRDYLTTAWWVITFPGLAILLAVIGFNLLGDVLRDGLDPRLRR